MSVFPATAVLPEKATKLSDKSIFYYRRAVARVVGQWCSPASIITSDNCVIAENKDNEVCNDKARIRPQEGRCWWKIRALVSSVGGSLSWWLLEPKAPEATKPAMTQNTSAAMIHPARIEELYFSKRIGWGQKDTERKSIQLFFFFFLLSFLHFLFTWTVKLKNCTDFFFLLLLFSKEKKKRKKEKKGKKKKKKRKNRKRKKRGKKEKKEKKKKKG